MRIIISQKWFLLLHLIPTMLLAQHKKPNIIFILTDDQRWDALGYAGNSIIQTPQMDALARSGTYFKNAFSTTPICAASRASILTGLYERTHGYTFQKPRLKQPYVDIMYPKILKEHGYHTGFFGKLGVIIDNANRYFDESDFYDRGNSPDKYGYFFKKIGNDTVHLTKYSGHQAQEFIKKAPSDKPFCLSVSFSAPHGHDNSKEQYFWQKKSDTLYENTVIPSPVLGDDLFFNALPLQVRDGYNRTRWKWRFDTPEKYQQMVKGYYRMITEIDDEIGLIREQLRKKGVEDNTIIIVMGDNGYFLGDRQLADKWLMYDASIRIPLIIFDPRQIRPSSIDAMALNIDIARTIFDLAGIDAPITCQGESLKPFIEKGNVQRSRKSILIEHLWPLPEIPSSEGIRTAAWKYFRYRLIDAPEELYDLENDPGEMKNLAGDPKFSLRLASLRKECDELSSKYKQAKLCPDDPFITEKKF
jgi:alpha-L-rhamnosidase